MKIAELRTNHIENPVGFDLAPVVLSYKVLDAPGKRSVGQRVRIARDEAFREIVFDSGRREDMDSKCFVPAFTPAPEARYFWDAEVWDDAGGRARSEAAFFETPPERPAGRWIQAPFDKDVHPLFLRKFTVPGQVRSARLYISGLGLYEAYLNGKRVGDEFLTPGCNDYNHWIQFQTYDVTDKLIPGENALGVMLGNGWYKGRFGFEAGLKELYGDRMEMIAELKVILEDGSAVSVGSDESFLCHPGPVLASSIYDGEEYDSRREVPGFAAVGCDMTGWVPAEPATEPTGRLCPRRGVPVTVHERLKPVEVIHTPAGETVLDFGQEITGMLSFVCRAPRNGIVTLQFGEILQGGNFYTENLRTAQQKFIYYADGAIRTVRQHFTFYGFRYVKVEGVKDPDPTDYTAWVLHSDLKRTGWLETSDPKVNRLIDNALWGQKGNFVDVPTDCPQRDERMGWTGDAQVFCATACFNMDTTAFFAKYMYDMLTEQREPELDGSVPYVVPDILDQINRVIGREEMSPGSCAWGDAATVIPWTSYVFSGDVTLLEKQYESMKRWTDYIRRVDDTCCGGRRLWQHGFHFADWLALDNYHKDSCLGGTDPYFVASAYYLWSASLTAKAAKALGRTEEAAAYAELAEQVRRAMRAEYFTPTGRLAVDTQTAMVLALHFDIVPEAFRARIVGDLKRKLDEENIHLTTGFVGTAYLCRTLSENGLGDYAGTLLLNEDYPSWLYEVNMGATTVWERWNSVLPDGSISDTGMNSLNHYAYGAVVEWIYRFLGGLNPSESEPGFRRFTLRPEPDARFGRVSLRYDSPYGLIESAWERAEGGWRFTVTVPFDTRADFVAPGGGEALLEGVGPVRGEIRLACGRHTLFVAD